MDRSPDNSERNRGTILPPGRTSGVIAPSLREHFARVARELHAPSSLGYQVFAVDGPHLRSIHLAPAASAFAVLGRHVACDLALLDDPAISLRHLLLRAVRLEHGGLALRVIDLATPRGFRTDEDAALTAVVAEGPFAFRVGGCAVFAIPSGVSVSPDLPVASSHRSLVAPRVLAPSHPRRDSPSPSRWQSHITVVPPPSSAAPASEDEEGERVLGLRSGGKGMVVSKSLEALAAGVLLGRYDRCDADARRLMGEGISRVHALLLHEGDDDFVFDLASTNGTTHGGIRIRRAALAHDDHVVLAPESLSRLHISWRHRCHDRGPILWN